MKTIRSVAGILAGLIAGVVLTIAILAINHAVYPGHAHQDGKDGSVGGGDMPTGALAIVAAGWAAGAFTGGAVAALVAGRARLVHAGIIGAFFLTATIAIFLHHPGHPNCVILAGLLLPLPVSMLGGKLVSPRTPSSPPMANP